VAKRVSARKMRKYWRDGREKGPPPTKQKWADASAGGGDRMARQAGRDKKKEKKSWVPRHPEKKKA